MKTTSIRGIVIVAALTLVAAAVSAQQALAEDPTPPAATGALAGRLEAAPPALGSDGSGAWCDVKPSAAREVGLEVLDLGPRKLYLEEPFACWFCEECAASEVNPACCFDGQGGYGCVSSCTSGCVDPVPVRPEPEP